MDNRRKDYVSWMDSSSSSSSSSSNSSSSTDRWVHFQ